MASPADKAPRDNDKAASERYADSERSGSSRGHGGWSGDSEGHSEASRRGWERRR